VEHLEIIVLGLLVAVAGLVLLADVARVPYPIFLVVGGLVLGFVPGVPEVVLAPDLVLLIFLPPLLYSAAFFSSLRDLRANIRPIGLLSVGLVLLTTVVVSGVAHWAVGLPWAAAFALGAIVSPTDPVAATAIAERLGVPRRIVTVLEGESLINDGTALVLYKVAVGAVVYGTFSFTETGLRLVLGVLVGVAIGLAVGWVVASARRRLENPLVEITISMFTGYAAYIPAEELGASGVLAAVAAGLYLNRSAPEISLPAHPPASIGGVGRDRVYAQLDPVYPYRAAVPVHTPRTLGGAGVDPPALRRARVPDGDRGTRHLGLPSHVPPPLPEPKPARA